LVGQFTITNNEPISTLIDQVGQFVPAQARVVQSSLSIGNRRLKADDPVSALLNQRSVALNLDVVLPTSPQASSFSSSPSSSSSSASSSSSSSSPSTPINFTLYFNGGSIVEDGEDRYVPFRTRMRYVLTAIAAVVGILVMFPDNIPQPSAARKRRLLTLLDEEEKASQNPQQQDGRRVPAAVPADVDPLELEEMRAAAAFFRARNRSLPSPRFPAGRTAEEEAKDAASSPAGRSKPLGGGDEGVISVFELLGRAWHERDRVARDFKNRIFGDSSSSATSTSAPPTPPSSGSSPARPPASTDSAHGASSSSGSSSSTSASPA
jgi:hypothetical protein